MSRDPKFPTLMSAFTWLQRVGEKLLTLVRGLTSSAQENHQTLIGTNLQPKETKCVLDNSTRQSLRLSPGPYTSMYLTTQLSEELCGVSLLQPALLPETLFRLKSVYHHRLKSTLKTPREFWRLLDHRSELLQPKAGNVRSTLASLADVRSKPAREFTSTSLRRELLPGKSVPWFGMIDYARTNGETNEGASKEIQTRRVSRVEAQNQKENQGEE